MNEMGRDGYDIENRTFSKGGHLGNKVERDQSVQGVPHSMVANLSFRLS
jgi:hypothetical protein